MLVDMIADAFARSDPSALALLYEEDAVLHHPLIPAPVHGRLAIAQAEEGLFTSYSAHEWEPTAVVSDNHLVAVQYVLRLTNTGPMPTREGFAPPTGRRLEFQGASFFHLSPGGLIAREHRFAASEGLRMLLGFERL